MLGRISSSYESRGALARVVSSIAGCFIAAACSAGGGSSSFSDSTGPANGAGGDGVIFGGGTGANGSAGSGVQMRIGDTNCVANVRQGEHVPLDLYIMFDQSASM